MNLLRRSVLLAALAGVLLVRCGGVALEPGADLSGRDLSGRDLRGLDLSTANMHNANLRAAALNGAKLLYANLAEADLSEADLQGAWLEKADMSRASLRGAKAQQANLQGVNLQGADLSEANLTGANLAGADLTGASLTGATLDQANLAGAKGVTDELLNTAASSSNVRLEDQKAMLKLMQQACNGQGVEQAAAYTGEPGLHPVVLLRPSITGVRDAALMDDLVRWPDSLPDGWEALAVGSTELVACTEYVEEVIETCQYMADVKFNLDRYRHKAVIRLVEARTGITVATHTFRGDLPPSCKPIVHVPGAVDLEGSPVSFAALKDWLSQFVNR